MRKLKKLIAAFLCAAMAMGLTVSAQAAETRTPITSVQVDLDYTIGVGDESADTELTVKAGSDKYSIGDYYWVGAPEIWGGGDIPKLKIEIYAKSGYYFDGVTSSRDFTINGGEYSTSSRSDRNETLMLTVKLDRVTGDLGETDRAEWSGYMLGRGEWEEVPAAGYYELKLYRNGSSVKSFSDVSGTYFDFYPYMTKKGTYTFKVRAVARTSAEKKYLSNGPWVESDELDITEEDASNGVPGGSGTPGGQSVSPGWQQDHNGWWYRNPDGSYQRDNWLQVNGKWYLFDSNGYMLTGWQNRNGRYYYMSGSGDMQTGWLPYNNHWYYLDPSNGDMRTGWVVVGSTYYYMDASGVMQTGWQQINGYYYYFDPSSGAMARNQWVGSYYVNNDGVWVQ